MYRYREDTAKGQKIGDNIRKILLNADLRLVYAEAERKLAYEDYSLYSKLGGKNNTRKAIKAKAEMDCYSIYIENVKNCKAEISVSLDAVLSRYNPRYKRVWIMYFLEQASVDDIADEVGYTQSNTLKIVQRLKLDLCTYYEDSSNEKV